MREMIKAEREKILSRKPVRFLFVMGLFLIAVYFFLFQFGYASVFYRDDTGELDSASGFEAIRLRKEVAGEFEGGLTPETLARMRQKIAEAEDATAGRDEDTAFSARYMYRDQAALLERMTAPDGKLKSIGEVYPRHASVVLGYCDGWDAMLSGMGSILSILLCLFLTVALSPVFSQEYALHTDSVIYAARYGKTRLVTSKIVASLQAAGGAYLAFLIMDAALCLGVYGAQGWNVSIQSSLHYAASTAPLTFLQMFLISAALGVVGIAAMTMITLLVSAEAGTPVAALLASCAACFLPILFDFTESVPFLQKLQELCPIYMLHPNGVFAETQTYAGVEQPVVMLALHAALIGLFGALTKRAAGRHQVVG